MHNWDYQKNTKLRENEVWYLERLLTYGLDGERVDRDMLIRNFQKIHIPEHTRAFLELLLWNKPF